MSWDPIASPVDHVVLAGKPSPGIAEIVGAESLRKWAIRRGYALTGATTVFRGLDVARFTIELRLYTSEHWADWHAWKQIVLAVPRGRTGHLDIQHPLLDELGIHSCAVESVQQPVQVDDGEWMIAIKCIEHRAPKIALATPEGSKTATEPDPYEQRIEQLSQQFRELAQ